MAVIGAILLGAAVIVLTLLLLPYAFTLLLVAALAYTCYCVGCQALRGLSWALRHSRKAVRNGVSNTQGR
jgi:hypothetical protein